jgi:Asp-tRNA(Asn)/Glu-tRNA(Gln) amidotransferase C subunit
MREDIAIDKSEIGKKILSHAALSEDDFFIVPAILE